MEGLALLHDGMPYAISAGGVSLQSFSVKSSILVACMENHNLLSFFFNLLGNTHLNQKPKHMDNWKTTEY